MSEDNFNGKVDCGMLNGVWSQYQKELTEMGNKIEVIHDNLGEFGRHIGHLSKLDTIADAVVDMKDNLISVATGKSQIPLDVAKVIFDQKQTSSDTTVKTLGAVIVVLLAVIGFLLIGEHFGWIRTLFNPNV